MHTPPCTQIRIPENRYRCAYVYLCILYIHVSTHIYTCSCMLMIWYKPSVDCNSFEQCKNKTRGFIKVVYIFPSQSITKRRQMKSKIFFSRRSGLHFFDNKLPFITTALTSSMQTSGVLFRKSMESTNRSPAFVPTSPKEFLQTSHWGS